MPFHGKPSDDRHAATREMDPRPCYKDAAKGENVTEILYYIEKTILLVYPPATRRSRLEVCSSYQPAKKWKKPGKQFGEPNYLRGVQEHEDARTSHPCERRARDRKAFF
jgi:hypothetical protein